MKKVFIGVAALVFAFVSISSFAANSNNSKIGIVNVQQVLEKSGQMQALNNKLKSQFEPRAKKLEADSKTFEKNVENFKKNSSVMNAAKRKTAEVNLGKERANIEKQQISLQRDSVVAQNKSLQTLLDKVKTIVDKIALKNQLNLVLTNASVAYSKGELDITSQVATQLKKQS